MFIRSLVSTAALTAAFLPVITGAVAAPQAFSASKTVPAIVHGSLATSAFWTQQGAADCLPMTTRAIVATMTGRMITPKAMDKTAARVADYDVDGSTFDAAPALFGAYGVPAIVQSNATMDMLRASLDRGAPVMADVDPVGIWALFGLAPAVEGEMHALTVEQIDDRAHMVTLVDTAWSGGMAETVPTTIFLNAWDASGRAAVFVG